MTAPVTVAVADLPMVPAGEASYGLVQRPARKGDVVEVPYTDGVGEWDRLLRLTEEPVDSWTPEQLQARRDHGSRDHDWELTGVWEDR